jgi:fluoroquinolone resistance protein
MASTENILHERKTFISIDYSDKTLSGMEFIKCVFENCNFANSNLGGNDFMDCHFKNCSFAMAKVNGSGLSNAMFSGCKIMGVDFSECNKFLFSFKFENCVLDYSTFAGTKMKGTHFINSSLKEVDFERTDLTGAVFKDCDLSEATFINSNLETADFTTARHFSIDPSVNKMKKAKFSYRELAGLLHKYQLNISFD